MLRTTLSLLLLALLVGRATVAEDSPSSERRTATFSMYCYWTGEATLGLVDGVEASRIGHWAGSEIVQVDYDPAKTSLSELAAALEEQRSLDAVFVDDPAEREAAKAALGDATIRLAAGRPRFIEPKHSLRTAHPELAALELTEAQAIALNGWSYFGGPMPDVLTEEQRAALASSR